MIIGIIIMSITGLCTAYLLFIILAGVGGSDYEVRKKK